MRRSWNAQSSRSRQQPGAIRSGRGEKRPRPGAPRRTGAFRGRARGRQGIGCRGQAPAHGRRYELSRRHRPAHRPSRAAEGRYREQSPQGCDHREQWQDNDLPNARRLRAGGRHQRRPEPVWIELDPGGDLGCRAGSRPAGQDRRPAAAAGSRRGDDATGGARGGARHDPGHQRLPRPARPIRRALLDGTDAGGRHRGAACPRQRGPQRRRPARGELRSRTPRPAASTSAFARKTSARRFPSTPRTRSAACTASTP